MIGFRGYYVKFSFYLIMFSFKRVLTVKENEVVFGKYILK